MSTSWYSLRFAAIFPPIQFTEIPLASLGFSIFGASSSFRFLICSLRLNQFSPRVLKVFYRSQALSREYTAFLSTQMNYCSGICRIQSKQDSTILIKWFSLVLQFLSKPYASKTSTPSIPLAYIEYSSLFETDVTKGEVQIISNTTSSLESYSAFTPWRRVDSDLCFLKSSKMLAIYLLSQAGFI